MGVILTGGRGSSVGASATPTSQGPLLAFTRPPPDPVLA